MIRNISIVELVYLCKDRSYVTLADMNDFFLNEKTATGGKSKEIRDMPKLHLYDPKFSTEKLTKSNPRIDNLFT